MAWSGAGRWERRAGAATVVLLVAVFALVACLALTRTTDPDLFWHLATGDWILAHREVPRAEPFSYTVPGRHWIDAHWLFQVGLSLLRAAGGWSALTLLKTALILLLFAGLYRRGRRHAGRTVVAATLILAALACEERFLMRPEIVSWLLLLAAIEAVERALARDEAAGRRHILWILLPLLQVLWVNVQGLFILGPVVAGLGLGAALYGTARGPAARRDLDRPIDFLVGLALLGVASLLNPNGAATLRLPFDLLLRHLGGVTLLSRTIAEFRPPFSGYLVTPSIVAFGILLALTAAVVVANGLRGGARPFELLLLLAMLYLALKARRNIPLFVIAAAPALLRNGAGVAGALRPAFGRRLASLPLPSPPAGLVATVVALLLAAATAGTAAAVVTDRYYLIQPAEHWWGIGPIPSYFPEEAARFVEQAALPGQVFHSLAIGGFLIDAWHGERRVFIDGRNDPYLDGVLQTYLQAIADPAAFEAAVRRYQITAVLWPHQRALEGKTLLAYLEHDPGWVLVHLDAGGAVYVRTDALTPGLASGAPSAAGGGREAAYADLAGQLDAAPFAGPPIRAIALAEYFSATGDPRGAQVFYERALRRLPDRPRLLHDEALALERQGKRVEARAAYERAVAADPGFLPAVAALGSMALDDGRLDEAARRLQRAYRGGERGAQLLSARARLLERQGRLRESVAAWQEAVRAWPRNTGLLRELGVFYERHGEQDAALSFYAAAGKIDPDDPVTATATALLLERLGRASAALDVARDGARRAADRIAAGRGGTGEAERSMLRLAAQLELQAGRPDRAAIWQRALAGTAPPEHAP
jgi:tetratricopeptide (TPR) repeat protein